MVRSVDDQASCSKVGRRPHTSSIANSRRHGWLAVLSHQKYKRSMMRQKALWLALISQVLLGVAGSSFILCQEATGETMLEWSLVGCCGLSESSSGSGSLAWKSSDGCNACDDTSIAIMLQRENAASVLDLAVSSAPARQSGITLPATFSVIVPAPRAPPGLVALRTVSLLC